MYWAFYQCRLYFYEAWFVYSVELKLEAVEVHVTLRHHETADWPYPQCGAASKLYDHQPERQWRHLDICQYQTILHAEPLRSECREHGVNEAALWGAVEHARSSLSSPEQGCFGGRCG